MMTENNGVYGNDLELNEMMELRNYPNKMEFNARIIGMQFTNENTYFHLELTEPAVGMKHDEVFTLGKSYLLKESNETNVWSNPLQDALYAFGSELINPLDEFETDLIYQRLVGDIFNFEFVRTDSKADWELVEMTKVNESFNGNDLISFQGHIVSVSHTNNSIEVVFKLAISSKMHFHAGSLHQIYHYHLYNDEQKELFENTFDEFVTFDPRTNKFNFENSQLIVIYPPKKIIESAEFIRFDAQAVRPFMVLPMPKEVV